MNENKKNDFDFDETDYELVDEADLPAPNRWQTYELDVEELDCASGVCWHPATANNLTAPIKPSAERRLNVIRREKEVGLGLRSKNQTSLPERGAGYALLFFCEEGLGEVHQLKA
ncbi:hypothetical protein N9L70_09425 [Rhodobacteraceae bacterium]|nr:hypothetical protein [Paracoccaceae bacterium]